MDANKIGKVATVARSAEQKTTRLLQESQKQHQQKCDQLDQLRAFKLEYETNLKHLGSKGIAARQLLDYRLFLSKLDQSIDQQCRAVEASLTDLDLAREQSLATARRRTSLDKLLDQRHLESRQGRARAEQKESDESSLMRRFSDLGTD
ncbi:MAG: flagellar export protein FliJ [Halioglobus sp.]